MDKACSETWIDATLFHQPSDGEGRRAYMSAAAEGRWTPKLGDVRDSFEKSLDPKKMFALESKAKPRVVLAPKDENVNMEQVVDVKVEQTVECIPIKLEHLVKQEQVDYDDTDYIPTPMKHLLRNHLVLH